MSRLNLISHLNVHQSILRYLHVQGTGTATDLLWLGSTSAT